MIFPSAKRMLDISVSTYGSIHCIKSLLTSPSSSQPRTAEALCSPKWEGVLFYKLGPWSRPLTFSDGGRFNGMSRVFSIIEEIEREHQACYRLLMSQSYILHPDSQHLYNLTTNDMLVNNWGTMESPIVRYTSDPSSITRSAANEMNQTSNMVI